MKDCLFCKIVSGDIPSYKIYEDEHVCAFLDTANDVLGHTLVVPKKHIDNVLSCGERTFSRVMASVKKIADTFVQKGLCDGYNIVTNVGESAEQSVMHMHIHILPRKTGDGVKLWHALGQSGMTLDEVASMFKLDDEVKEQPNYAQFVEDCSVLYTDGACSGNPGVGGYGGVYITKDGKVSEFSGGDDNTTNNRMEMTAVIEGLSLTEEGETVKVYSDSAYVVNAFNQNWLKNWQANGWKSSGGGEVLNVDLWKELVRLTSKRNVQFVKVKGHADNVLNNRCDALATAYYKNKQI